MNSEYDNSESDTHDVSKKSLAYSIFVKKNWYWKTVNYRVIRQKCPFIGPVTQCIQNFYSLNIKIFNFRLILIICV